MKSITNVQSVLNFRSIRNIKLERKIIIFKTLALSKIVNAKNTKSLHLEQPDYENQT